MRENHKYYLLQIFYYMGFCVSQGYCTYYLNSYGFSFYFIGILTSVFYIMASFFQVIIGRILDRSKKLNWKNTLIAFFIIYEFVISVLYFTNSKYITGIFFGLMIMIMNIVLPVVNSISFYYKKKNIDVNFGISRGLGSMSFAVLSVILGRLTLRYGKKAVPLTGIAVTVLIIFMIIVLPYEKEKDEKTVLKDEKITNLIKKYPGFFVMVVGATLMFSFYNMYSTYLISIIENVGGDTADFGIALALSAAVEIPVMFNTAKLSEKFDSAKMIFIAGIGLMIKGIIYIYAKNMYMIYFCQILQIISYAILAPMTVYFADRCMEDEDKVTGQSFMSLAMAAGSVFGNLIAGIVIYFTDIKTMLFSGVLITLIGTVLSFVSYRIVK